MGRRLLSVLAAAAAVIATTVVVAPPAPADAVLRNAEVLPMSSYGAHAVDLQGERIYLVPGLGDQRVVVTDLQGTPLDSADGLPGARSLALSDDGLSLFVALETSRIVRLDTATLTEAASYPLPELTSAQNLTWSGSHLWFTVGFEAGPLYTLAPESGEIREVPDVGFHPSALMSPPASGLLLARHGGYSTNLSVIDAAAGTVLETRVFEVRLITLSSSADGLPFVTMEANGEDRLTTFDPLTLETVRTTRFPAGTWHGTNATDGQVVTGATGTWTPHGVDVLDAATSTRITRWRLPYDYEDEVRVTATIMTPAGLIVLAEKADAVESYLVEAPQSPSSNIAFEVPGGVYIGRETTLTGALTDHGTPIAGAEVRISDIPGITGHHEVERTRVATTNGDGEFTFPFTPRSWNDVLTFEYDGDPAHPPAWHQTHGNFDHQPSVLDVTYPATPAPGEQITVSGILTALGAPIPGADIEVRQACTNALPTTVGTDAEGSFDLMVTPGRCQQDGLTFRYVGNWTYQSLWINRVIEPTWLISDVTVVQPVEDGVVGSTFVWTGTVTRAGSVAPDVPVTYAITREFSSSTPIAAGTLRTDASGAFRIQETVEHADRYQLSVRYAGDDSTLGDSTVDSFEVLRIPTRLTMDDTDIEVLPDEAITLSGVVTTSNGTALADHPVEIWLDGDVLAPVRTDADGHFEFVTVPHPPIHWADDGKRFYGAHVVADSRHTGAWGTVHVTVAPEPTRLLLDEVPSPTGPGDVITLGGRLTTVAGGPLGGQEVELRHLDGEENVYHAVTDQQGRFAVETVVRTGHWQRLNASFAGTRFLAEAYATSEWESIPLPGALTLKPVPTRLLGEVVHLRGVLTDSEGNGESTTITVNRLNSIGGTEWTYEPVRSAADGSFSVAVPADRAGRFTFVVRSALWRVASQSFSVAVEVRQLELDSRAIRPAGVRRGWAIYDAATDPRIATLARPRRSELCLHYEVQRRVVGDWRSRSLSGCRDTDGKGEARYRIGGHHPAGSEFRVRPLWGEPTSVAGGWVKVRFR